MMLAEMELIAKMEVVKVLFDDYAHQNKIRWPQQIRMHPVVKTVLSR
jgi:hypothetical protein